MEEVVEREGEQQHVERPQRLLLAQKDDGDPVDEEADRPDDPDPNALDVERVVDRQPEAGGRGRRGVAQRGAASVVGNRSHRITRRKFCTVFVLTN